MNKRKNNNSPLKIAVLGHAVISPTVNSLHCVMYSDSICEFCFLMFRLFKLNFGKQDCRIAEKCVDIYRNFVRIIIYYKKLILMVLEIENMNVCAYMIIMMLYRICLRRWMKMRSFQYPQLGIFNVT